MIGAMHAHRSDAVTPIRRLITEKNTANRLLLFELYFSLERDEVGNAIVLRRRRHVVFCFQSEGRRTFSRVILVIAAGFALA